MFHSKIIYSEENCTVGMCPHNYSSLSYAHYSATKKKILPWRENLMRWKNLMNTLGILWLDTKSLLQNQLGAQV